MTPVEPPKNTIGRNTAESTSAMATSAIWICCIEMIGRFLDGQLGLLVEDALDILDHDDGVVDEQADREHQPEQGQRVDREAEDVEHPEGAEQHDRDGDSRDQRGAPALQEDEHDEDDEDHRLGEGLHHLDDGQADEVGRIVGVGDVIARRHRAARHGAISALTSFEVDKALAPGSR